MEQRKTIFIIMSALATMMMVGTLIWILITHSGDADLVFMHLKMYFDWKHFKDMEARTDAVLRHLEELSKADAEERLKNETGNSR